MPAFWEVTLGYCGPIQLKTRARKPRKKTGETDADADRSTYEKAWILVIVCRATSAYHLELVTDLSANAFLQAFECFISTRGRPFSIRSDNACGQGNQAGFKGKSSCQRGTTNKKRILERRYLKIWVAIET